MQEIIKYKYAFTSNLVKQKDKSYLFLANYTEIDEEISPFLFSGLLDNPSIVAKCLIVLYNIVKSNYSLNSSNIDLLQDPIVTVGNNKIRFEGFSNCTSIYARLDIIESNKSINFIKNGTTNVNFNQEVISALGKIRKKDILKLDVGSKQIRLSTKNTSVIERKVPLPTKWIKGLVNTQYYMSKSELIFTLNRIQALQLFKDIPSSIVKSDYYLFKRGTNYILSPVAYEDSIAIGGIERLKLLESLLPFIDKLKIYAKDDNQSTTWQLHFDKIIFSFSLSRNTWRGFSGEGASLNDLLEDLPNELIIKMNNFSYINQEFNTTLLAIEKDESFEHINNLKEKLAAIGMLGFDLEYNHYFYRKLPFKLNRILALNPRLKGVDELIKNDKVQILSDINNKTQAIVEGNGVTHYVLIEDSDEKCTCLWHSQNQGKRGACKHILAVKKLKSLNG